MAMNPTPAASFNTRGGIYAESWEPTRTAIKLESTRAPAEARKTPPLLVFCSAANRRVANWVLSPSSAKKTVTKIGQRFILNSSGSGEAQYTENYLFVEHAEGYGKALEKSTFSVLTFREVFEQCPES